MRVDRVPVGGYFSRPPIASIRAIAASTSSTPMSCARGSRPIEPPRGVVRAGVRPLRGWDAVEDDLVLHVFSSWYPR